jgi:hypothetical protein
MLTAGKQKAMNAWSGPTSLRGALATKLSSLASGTGLLRIIGRRITPTR